MKKKRVALVVFVCIALILTLYIYESRAGLRVVKAFNDCNGISTTIFNTGEEMKLNSRYYDCVKLLFFEDKAPTLYIEHRNDEKIIVKYQYISSTQKSVEDVAVFFKEFYKIEEEIDITEDRFQSFRVERDDWTYIIGIKEYDEFTRISFDAYQDGYMLIN